MVGEGHDGEKHGETQGRQTRGPVGTRTVAGIPIGGLHRFALTVFRRLPRVARVAAVRIIATSHTVGAVCFVEHDGRILVLRQHHRPGWTLPGGLVNRGERADQAVVRELREETGLGIEVDLPIGVVVEPRSRRVDIVFHVAASRAPQVQPGSEAIAAAWLRPDELGEIDEPTATILEVFRRWQTGTAHSGRLLDR